MTRITDAVLREEGSEACTGPACAMWMEATFNEEADNELMDDALAAIARTARRALKFWRLPDDAYDELHSEYRRALRRIIKTAREARYANLSLRGHPE